MTRLAHTDYPIHDLLRQRWSPRAFADRLPDSATVLRLLEAARWAPSSFNDQPWAFLTARRDQPTEFALLLDTLIEFNRSWAQTAAVLAVTVARSAFAHNGQPNRHAWHDIGLAVSQLTLQATAEGLFVHQMAGILPDRARELLLIPPGWEPVSALAIGYPGDPNGLPEGLRQRELAPSIRKPLSEFVFTGTWGQPH